MPPHVPVRFVDSHTAGEPTRVVVSGGPDLGNGSVAERCIRFREEHDEFRSFVVNEPRGSDVLVGALLVPPSDASCAAGVIFFNNVGVLGMCGHGTIGVVATLVHEGRLGVGEHRLETPVGIVTVFLDGEGVVSLENVPAYRYQAHVPLEVPGHGTLHGDIAWGGNWFFLVGDHGQELHIRNVEKLVTLTRGIRQALEQAGITGENGGVIDHIELYGPPGDASHQARNFVLCPGGAYDRSPCGTGTSAKLACLAAEGALAPGEPWRQEGILGTVFEGSYRAGEGGRIIPRIRGTAYITAEGILHGQAGDPFPWGIRPA